MEGFLEIYSSIYIFSSEENYADFALKNYENNCDIFLFCEGLQQHTLRRNPSAGASFLSSILINNFYSYYLESFSNTPLGKILPEKSLSSFFRLIDFKFFRKLFGGAIHTLKKSSEQFFSFFNSNLFANFIREQKNNGGV